MFAHDQFTTFLNRLKDDRNRELMEVIEKGFQCTMEGVPVTGIIPVKGMGQSPTMTMQVETANVYSNPSGPASADPTVGFSDMKDTPQSRAMDTLTLSEKDRGCDDEAKKKLKKKLADDD